MTGALPIITADQRHGGTRGIKGVIFGPSGIGKTSLLWTLLNSTTLFFDLEAGDLAIEGLAMDAIRPRTWAECRDFAVFIGGPNPALRADQPYSQAHFEAVCQKFGDPAVLENTTRCSSTRSPWPGGSALAGARASPRRSPRRPASPMCAARTACMAAR